MSCEKSLERNFSIIKEENRVKFYKNVKDDVENILIISPNSFANLINYHHFFSVKTTFICFQNKSLIFIFSFILPTSKSPKITNHSSEHFSSRKKMMMMIMCLNANDDEEKIIKSFQEFWVQKSPQRLMKNC